MAEVKIVVTAQDRASGPLGRIGGALGSMATVAGGIIAAGAITKIAGGLATAASAGFGFNNSMEQVTAKLNAFTKDGAKSAAILEMIEKRAAATPFAFEEMANATASLLPTAKQSGAALEGLIEQAEILAASNPAEGLEGAAFALKEAVSGDFTSIIERFNLPRKFINDLKAQGVPALEIVSRAMSELGLDTDLVTNLASTAEGRWSTFKDTLVSMASRLTEPIFNAWSMSLGLVNDALSTNMPLIEEFIGNLSGKLQGAMVWLQSRGMAALIDFGNWFTDTGLPAIQEFIGFVSSNVTPAMNRLNEIFTQVATGGGLQQLADFFGPTIERIKAGFQSFLTNLQPIVPAWEKFVKSLEPAMPGLTMLAQLIGGALLFALKAVGEILAVTLPLAGQAFADMFTFITETVNGFLTFLGGATEMIVGLFTGDLDAARAGAQKVFDGLKQVAMAAIQPIIDGIGQLAGYLEKLGVIDLGNFEPGSPTPFQRGLEGITGAMGEMARQAGQTMGIAGSFGGMQPLALGAGGNLGSLQAVKGELAQIYALTGQLNAAGVNLNINSTGNVQVGRGSNQGALKMGGMSKL